MVGLEIAIHLGVSRMRWLSLKEGDARSGLCRIGTHLPILGCDGLAAGISAAPQTNQHHDSDDA